LEEHERTVEGHPERYYSDYELARPIVRSFDDEFGEDVYDGHHEEWITPFWDPHAAQSPSMIHHHPAP
jgi:hypothetical protein